MAQNPDEENDDNEMQADVDRLYKKISVEKHEKLNSKLEEIKLLNHREKALELKKMVERQQKAERTKQRINKEKKAPMIAVHRKLKLMEEIKATEAKQREENLNKRFQNAAHKRDQIRSRKKSIDLSTGVTAVNSVNAVRSVGASLTEKNKCSEITDTVSDGEIVMEDESKLVDIAGVSVTALTFSRYVQKITISKQNLQF